MAGPVSGSPDAGADPGRAGADRPRARAAVTAHLRDARDRRLARGLILGGALALSLSACTFSDDPGEGGFYSGIAGLAGGGYEGRIAEREAAVGAETERRADLQGELAALRGEHETLATRIRAARARAAAEGTAIPPSLDLQAQAALAPPPPDLASLRASIEGARAVAEQLESLSS